MGRAVGLVGRPRHTQETTIPATTGKFNAPVQRASPRSGPLGTGCGAKESGLLSVIVPTLDEAEHLKHLLRDLGRQAGIVCEILVADGGSRDATRQVALAAGARWVAAPRGRGVQMNAAVRLARGAHLLFLHADTRLKDPRLLVDAVAALEAAAARAGHDRVAGHFHLRFVRRSDTHRRAYRFLEAKSALNREGTTHGDQGFLMPRRFFEALGRFDEQLPFLEDERLADRVQRQGRWITLPGTLYTSARRFEREGFWRRYLLDAIILAFFGTGTVAFFERAPHVYRVQAETRRLRLWPVFKVVWQIMAELGPRGSVRLWQALGRSVSRNVWQLFFLGDVLRGAGGGLPLLRLHDRLFEPLTRAAFCATLAGSAAFVAFMLVLGPCFRLLESDYPAPAVRRPTRSGGQDNA